MFLFVKGVVALRVQVLQGPGLRVWAVGLGA